MGRRRVKVPVLIYIPPSHTHTHTHRDIVDLREIQHDLAVMVEDQGEGIDRIGREGEKSVCVRMIQ